MVVPITRPSSGARSLTGSALPKGVTGYVTSLSPYLDDPMPDDHASLAAAVRSGDYRRVGPASGGMKPSDLRRYIVKNGKVTYLAPGETMPAKPRVASAHSEINLMRARIAAKKRR